MTVEEQHPIEHLFNKITQLEGRIEYLEKDFSQLLGLIEQLHTITDYFSIGKNEELQQLKELVAQVIALAKKKTERLIR
jgi:hypothetical protein